MKIIQSHPSFYLELSPEEIRLCTKEGACSTYPVWLGKNRAVMREAIRYFEKNPPQTLFDCLHLFGHFGLEGQSCGRNPIRELFTKEEKPLDSERVFW